MFTEKNDCCNLENLQRGNLTFQKSYLQAMQYACFIMIINYENYHFKVFYIHEKTC